jgi:NAD-dependent dihydropyrimidine dehydrogenase PreA subunit
MTGKLQHKKVYHVEVDGEACKDCGYCIEVCPQAVFRQADYFNAKGYRPVQVELNKQCIGCRRCFFACPDFAIDVIEPETKEGQPR